MYFVDSQTGLADSWTELETVIINPFQHWGQQYQATAVGMTLPCNYKGIVCTN